MKGPLVPVCTGLSLVPCTEPVEWKYEDAIGRSDENQAGNTKDPPRASSEKIQNRRIVHTDI